MKFKLVETINTKKSVLNEKTDIYYELSNYLMSDMSNNVYNPRAFISHLGEKKRQELIDGITNYVRTNYKLQDPQQIAVEVNNILTNWVVHHINGVHPDSYLKVDNSSHNIVLLNGQKLHTEVTDNYQAEIVKYTQHLPVLINDDVDKLLLRLIVVCRETGVNVSDILSIDISGFESALYNIPNKLTQYFESNYPRTRPDVIYLSDFNLSW